MLDQWLRDGWLRPIDHALGAALLRLRRETPEPVALAAALASRAVAFGHSVLPLDRVPDLLTEIAADRAPPSLPAISEWCTALRASPYVGAGGAAGTILVLEGERVALRRYRDYEVRLAQALAALAGPVEPAPDPEWLRACIARLFPQSADAGIDRQALAAAVAALRRVMLLTGGPGTGKTSTIARVLALAVAAAQQAGRDLRVVLAAPTGKAAARLSESLRENYARLLAEQRIEPALHAMLPTKASTLHRLLGKKPRSVQFRHDRDNPLAADLVVVDEASMVDLPLMCKLVEAVPPHARLILIGDRDQLPSVETGDVLAALCDAAGSGLAVPAAFARQASDALGADVEPSREASPLVRVELSRSYRQTAALDIASLSAAVRAGDATAALECLRSNACRGVRWRHGRDAALAAFVLDETLPHYRAIAAAPNVAAALAMLRRHRVLTAVREGEAGSRALNAHIALALQQPALRPDAFFHGRPVMIRENSYRHGLYNGDVGLVWRDDGEPGSAQVLRVWFETDAGPRAWLPAALPAHESAFALTVHKSQGSEFDDVLLVLPERSVRVSSRELIYTGITRARNSLTLWANEDVLAEAIARRAQRWSGLASRLCNPPG